MGTWDKIEEYGGKTLKTVQQARDLYQTWAGDESAPGVPGFINMSGDTNVGAYGFLIKQMLAGGLNTPDQFLAVSQLDPMTGVAPIGTDFASLQPAQQKAYIANAYIIGLAKAAPTGALTYKPIYDALKGQEAALGWCMSAGEPGCAPRPGQLLYTQDGRILYVQMPEIQAAADRLSRADLSSATGAPTMQPGLPTQSTMPPALSACLAMPSYPAKQRCAADVLRQNPDYALMFKGLAKPYADLADPNKFAQLTIGLDGKRYVVLGKNAGFGFRLTYGIAGVVGVSVIGATVVGGVVLWAFGTKGGKKFRKKYIPILT